ncbi:MAG TPA: cupin domain-containing protein [Acidobacteriaceae bacterium]|jgi:quercetin dioxygenase-like cupin family protein|nr:cupin domain-containing protein [Acidobacteriaceae bacterium]
MIRHCSAAVIGIIAVTSLSSAYAQTAADKVAAAQSQVLLKADHSWNGKPYTQYPKGRPELTMLKLTIAPHTKLPWHTHPMPNAAYVLSGTLTLHDKLSGKTRVVHQGEAFAESVDDIHRGETGDETTVLLVTYSGTPGVPTTIPAKGEQAEY